MKLML